MCQEFRQGVYKFNQANFQEIPGGILRKIQDMFALLRPPSESWNTHNMGISALFSRIGIWGSVISSPTGVLGRALAENGFWCIWNLKNTSDGDKFRIFATNIYPYFYDWKPMRSIFDILHKNFQEDQSNSRRFPGFPGGFLYSRRFLGFPGVVDTLSEKFKSRCQVPALLLIFTLNTRLKRMKKHCLPTINDK